MCSFGEDANCISITCPIKRSHSAPLFCLAGQVSRPVAGKAKCTFAGDVESHPSPISVCEARPHTGAGASAHVLNHNTQHPHQQIQKTYTNTQNTPHNPIKTPQATGISILQVNINGITNKQEELKQLAYTTQQDIITIQETKLPPHPKHPK